MVSPLVSATLQAAVLAAISHVMAQSFKAYRSETSFDLNSESLSHFVLIALFMTPINFAWQNFLERTYPGYETGPKGKEGGLNKTNTAIKFVLDQTVGASFNTLGFIAGIGYLQHKDSATIQRNCKENFFPMIQSGLKVWPAVCLANLTLVPVNSRLLVGNLVGLFWGMYINIITTS